MLLFSYLYIYYIYIIYNVYRLCKIITKQILFLISNISVLVHEENVSTVNKREFNIILHILNCFQNYYIKIKIQFLHKHD